MIDNKKTIKTNPKEDRLPKISIVVPVLNMAKYIERTLDSIIKQRYPNFEVIIQDGLSTDGTVEVAQRLARKYPQIIRFYSGRDKGQFDALYKGFRKATGEIYTFINGDDYYEKNAFFAVGKDFLKYPHTLWMVGRGRIVDEKGREFAKWVTWYKNFLLKMNKYSFLLLVNYVMQPSVFFSKEAYKQFGPITGDKIHIREFDFWYKLGKVEMPGVINRYLSCYSFFPGVGSARYCDVIRKDDYYTTKKYTKNPLILLLRYLHNWARVFVYKIFYSK